jgi:hypothetical protein
MPRPPGPETQFNEEIQIDAASAAVLLFPNRRDAFAALRCTLAGLGLAGVLRHEPRPDLDVFAIGEVPPGIVLPPPMRAIHSLLYHEQAGEAKFWTRQQLRLMLQAEFGVGYRRFIRSHVYPWLIERGLIEEQETQVFSIIPASRFQPTATGKLLQSKLRKLRGLAELLPEMIERDPRAAAIRVVEMGPAFLLANTLAPYYRSLATILFAEGENLDLISLRKSSADQRAVWVDAVNPIRFADVRMLIERLDAALAACDFVDNGG